MATESFDASLHDDDEGLLADLLGEYVERHAGGETVTEDIVRAEHPNEAGLLIPELRALQALSTDAEEGNALRRLGDYRSSVPRHLGLHRTEHRHHTTAARLRRSAPSKRRRNSCRCRGRWNPWSMRAHRVRRRYDHRFQELVHETGDVEFAVKNGVPRSTARDWAQKSVPSVVSLDVARMSECELRQEVKRLRERNAKLVAILRLVVVLINVCEVSLARRRVPQSRNKRLLLDAVERSSEVLGVRRALRVVGLSKTRYHTWKREEECELDDASSCPQSHPQQITVEEREVVKEMVTCDEYRHVPTSTLALLAQRLGRVFASATTWHRLVRRYGWRRPRRRVHPEKPKLGIRASAANEIWHVDTSVVRLLDGTRAYLYAIIDNLSRRILAWRVSETFDPTNTVAILLEAGKAMVSNDRTPTLLADGGIENRTEGIDELINSGVIRRVLAQVEISCSNSMIESWWRQLKHQWLFLNSLDSAESVRRLAGFYVLCRDRHKTYHADLRIMPTPNPSAVV